MTLTVAKSLADQAAALLALVEGWQAGHEVAEEEALAQLAAAVRQVKALERTMRARQARYRSELGALRHQLGLMISDASGE